MKNPQRPSTLRLGSYSHGTLREQDLIQTFIDAAIGLHLTRNERQTVNDLHRRFITRTSFEKLSAEYFSNGESEADLETLRNVLEDHVPDYCYFGSHPGDGSDFGVWVVDDLLDDSRQGSFDDCVYRSSDYPGMAQNEWSAAARYSHWLVVNERGNCTLFRRQGTANRWREIWSVV